VNKVGEDRGKLFKIITETSAITSLILLAQEFDNSSTLIPAMMTRLNILITIKINTNGLQSPFLLTNPSLSVAENSSFDGHSQEIMWTSLL